MQNCLQFFIWECFFAFTMCRENTYILRLLAIIFIHKTESIIFISNFIIKILKLSIFIASAVMQKVYCLRTICTKKSSHMGVFFCVYWVSRKYHISRLLAIIFIYKAESIIFITNFIIK